MHQVVQSPRCSAQSCVCECRRFSLPEQPTSGPVTTSLFHVFLSISVPTIKWSSHHFALSCVFEYHSVPTIKWSSHHFALSCVSEYHSVPTIKWSSHHFALSCVSEYHSVPTIKWSSHHAARLRRVFVGVVVSL